MADIWSTGIILYAILFGRYPFNAQEREYARRIVDAAYVIPADVPVSPVCLDLVRRILVADPAKRLSMEGIKRHPWFLKDLPPGALDMNDFYLQAPPFLDQVRPLPGRTRFPELDTLPAHMRLTLPECVTGHCVTALWLADAQGTVA